MGEYTQYNVFYKPSLGASGTAQKELFDAGLERADRLTRGAPPGLLINGAISVTVSAGDLTVAIKTSAGADPTASDPVWCNVGARTVTITSALSMTREAGALSAPPRVAWSWLNLSRPPVSGCEVDLFVYLGWNASQATPMLLVSREGWHRKCVFSSETSGHGAMCNLATGDDPAQGYPDTSFDDIAVCGRFNAINTTPNVWSSPSSLVIAQTPIESTRMLSWNFLLTPVDDSGNPTGGSCSPLVHWHSHYQLEGPWLNILFHHATTYSASSTVAKALLFEVPTSSQEPTVWNEISVGIIQDGGVYYPMFGRYLLTNSIRLRRANRTTLTDGTIFVSGQYRSYIPGTSQTLNY